MKNIHKIITSLVLATMMISFSACDQSDPLSVNQDVQLKKDRTLRTASVSTDQSTSTDLPNSNQFTASSVTETVAYHRQRKTYWGTFLNIPSTNSTFYFDTGSITPPASIQYGKDFQLTFSVVLDTASNELVYTFDPHGCTFDPPAELTLDYNNLGTDAPQLFYIEDDGSYSEQTPDNIDPQNRWITLYIHHFSRYAVAYGR